MFVEAARRQGFSLPQIAGAVFEPVVSRAARAIIAVRIGSDDRCSRPSGGTDCGASNRACGADRGTGDRSGRADSRTDRVLGRRQALRAG
jgi:hypothetical protein